MRTRIIPLAGILLLTSCASAGAQAPREHAVFAMKTGFSQGGPAETIDIIDLGLPLLHNTSGQPARLVSVSLVTSARAIHVRSVVAYKYSQIHGGWGAGLGNILKYCRKYDTPYPVRDVTVAPHSDAAWNVVISFTITKSGRYYIGQARIKFRLGGQLEWQYQNLHTTMVIKSARPGARQTLSGC